MEAADAPLPASCGEKWRDASKKFSDDRLARSTQVFRQGIQNTPWSNAKQPRDVVVLEKRRVGRRRLCESTLECGSTQYVRRPLAPKEPREKAVKTAFVSLRVGRQWRLTFFLKLPGVVRGDDELAPATLSTLG